MIQVGGQRKPISEVGEFGLIRGVRNLVRTSKVYSSGVTLGIGDDTALWRPRPGHEVIVTTDMLVEGVHFRHDWSKAESIGHKALAANLSDVAAMGGRPRVAVVSLGLKGNESDRWVYEFYRGAMKLGAKYHFTFAGGDIVHSPKATTVNVTLLGEISPRRPAMRRDTARPGDVIAVTGQLGLAAAGARLLADDRLQADGAPRMLDAHRIPEPRVLQGLLLRWAGVRCAMDLSDGLLGDLPKICDASEVQAIIEEDRLPVPHALRWSFDDWFDLATRGGEDFELLFTCPEEQFVLVALLFNRFGCPLPVRIGTIEEPKENRAQIQLRRTDRKRVDIEAGAYDHFRAAGS